MTANRSRVCARSCAQLRAPDGPAAPRAQAKAADAGEPWVVALAGGEYGALPLGERVRALARLAHLALDGPLVRACQDARLDEAARVRKLMWDESKARARPRTAGALLPAARPAAPPRRPRCAPRRAAALQRPAICPGLLQSGRGAAFRGPSAWRRGAG